MSFGFFQAIDENKETPVTGIDGLMPVLIAFAAKKSLLEGRAVNLIFTAFDIKVKGIF
jgi:myo-inositol 2-dehydrogenase/D-chiro-inositol 1-dehydrogenase